MSRGFVTPSKGLAVADAIPRLPLMLKSSLKIDVAGFEREVDTHMLKAFRPAVADALNAAGEAAVDAVRKGMLTAFDRPKPFTLDGVGFFKASVRSDGGDPSILIYIKDRTASYIDVHGWGCGAGPERIAALRATGRVTPGKRTENEGRLARVLMATGRDAAGSPAFMGYDPPFALPFLRRNEVAFRLTSS
ncbi:heme-binding protein [Methylobacterium fujisawaense]|uniref:heme-binding protein n=1 Tax=Methylobacterium fujisawaense TaxID=107400 RepID=UPI00379EE13C